MGGVTPRKKICKVLVVEDDSDIRELLGDLFAAEGYHFTLAANAAEMRAALASDPDYDILIADVRLPGESGLILAEEAAARGLPVILTSGDGTHFDKIETSGRRHLVKPYRIPALLALIDETLQATKANCERERRAAG